MKLIIILCLASHLTGALGACGKTHVCRLSKQKYAHMCTCGDNPASCKSGKCAGCVLQEETCAASPTCCPILNGKSFCNAETKKCEAMRYCPEDGSACHQFDDLSPAEVAAALKIIRKSPKFSTDIQFPVARTWMPTKTKWNSGRSRHHRYASITVFDSSKKFMSEVVVDVTARRIVKKLDLPPSHLPPVTDRETNDATRLFFTDPRVQNAYARRGLNLSYAKPYFLAVGSSGPLVNLPGKRLLKMNGYYLDPQKKYVDWTPIEGLSVAIDLNKNVVESVSDVGNIPLNPAARLSRIPKGPKLKPLAIVQNDGSSIRIVGQQIHWYKWKLMYTVDPIFGLVLYHVRYNADCEDRLVLYRIGASEMLVPYGAAGSEWRYRQAFDAGEYGIGKSATPLILGQDVPENALMANCTLVNSLTGQAWRYRHCVAAYERDIGMLYKHAGGGKAEDGRRGREMVVTFLATLGNYDYAFEYIFQMDGTIRVNVRMTGITLPRGVPSTHNDAACLDSCTTFVNAHTITPVHQHFINYRIDFDIDGHQNYVQEVDVVQDPVSVTNPDGGAFSVKRTTLKQETWRDYDGSKGRTWHVINANSRNRFGVPRGYALRPSSMAFNLAPPKSPFYPQEVFVAHPFWATREKWGELAAGGKYPRSGIPYQGLPKFTKDGEKLENADAVVWHTLGVTHTTRSEEWPLMNVQNAGFSLVPYNFISQNSEVPQKGRCP